MIHYPSKAENITSAMLQNSKLGEVNTTAQVSHVIEHYAPNQKNQGHLYIQDTGAFYPLHRSVRDLCDIQCGQNSLELRIPF